MRKLIIAAVLCLGAAACQTPQQSAGQQQVLLPARFSEAQSVPS
jgi:hypothetical protein